MHYAESDCVADLGSNVYIWPELAEGMMTAPLVVDDTPLVLFRMQDGHLLLTVQLFDEDNEMLMQILDNELVYSVDQWDIQFEGLRLTVRAAYREIFVRMSFKPPSRVQIDRGHIWRNGVEMELWPDPLVVMPGMTISGSEGVRCRREGDRPGGPSPPEVVAIPLQMRLVAETPAARPTARCEWRRVVSGDDRRGKTLSSDSALQFHVAVFDTLVRMEWMPLRSRVRHLLAVCGSRSWRRRRSQPPLCCVLVLALLSAGASTAVAASRGAARPASVVRAYVAALDRHDSRAVCGLFAAQLRAFEIKWDAPPPGATRSCASTVAAHFRKYYSRHQWVSASVRGSMHTVIEPRTGIAAVHFMLLHRYRCAPRALPPARCRPSRYLRPEGVYLISSRDGWAIIKPGLVYEATTIPTPLGQESDYYPPGNAATIGSPVSLPATKTSCPPNGARYVAPAHGLQSTFEPNPTGAPGHHPDLTVDAVAVSRIAGDTSCFTITLAAPPRPLDAYDIFIGTVAREAAAELFSVEFDGLGNSHPLLGQIGGSSTPSLQSDLPRVSLSGDQLQLIGSNPVFRNTRFLVVVGTRSIEDDEPLITRPVDAGDLIPLGGCLIFPTGQLDHQGNCGATPGP